MAAFPGFAPQTLRRSAMLAALALSVGAAGCDGRMPLPELGMEPGSRNWIITVTNESNQPARLFVALDESPMGELVGRVDPPQVPPGEEIEVSLIVPPGDGWAVFVNPTANRGPLILARDVPPDVSGALPLHVFVDAAGESSVSVPARPGWFGN